MKNTTEYEKDFQIWLSMTEERLQQLRELLPTEISKILDFSVLSLNILEAYILDTYQTIEQIRSESEQNMILDKLARYFGEVARKQVPDCYWYIILNNKKNVYYRLPIIYVLHPKYLNDCPMYCITATISRKKGTFLSTLITNFKRYADENRGKVPAFENKYQMPIFV